MDLTCGFFPHTSRQRIVKYHVDMVCIMAMPSRSFILQLGEEGQPSNYWIQMYSTYDSSAHGPLQGNMNRFVDS